MKSPLSLSKSDFSFFAEMIHKKSGIFLPENEKNIILMRQRLSKLIGHHDLKNFDELKTILQKHPPINFMNDFISALTTNKTEFFRESLHYDFVLKTLETELKNKNRLRVWCAASSTGQEAYTLSILLHENGFSAWDSQILSTDINQKVLRYAKLATYKKQELYGLNKQQIAKYFTETQGKYKLKNELARMVTFAPFNLLAAEYPFRECFDFVFCRNVLIYFDSKDIQHVISHLSNSLKPNGYLILGVSESGISLPDKLRPLGGSIFQRAP